MGHLDNGHMETSSLKLTSAALTNLKDQDQDITINIRNHTFRFLNFTCVSLCLNPIKSLCLDRSNKTCYINTVMIQAPPTPHWGSERQFRLEDLSTQVQSGPKSHKYCKQQMHDG